MKHLEVSHSWRCQRCGENIVTTIECEPRLMIVAPLPIARAPLTVPTCVDCGWQDIPDGEPAKSFCPKCDGSTWEEKPERGSDE